MAWLVVLMSWYSFFLKKNYDIELEGSWQTTIKSYRNFEEGSCNPWLLWCVGGWMIMILWHIYICSFAESCAHYSIDGLSTNSGTTLKVILCTHSLHLIEKKNPKFSFSRFSRYYIGCFELQGSLEGDLVLGRMEKTWYLEGPWEKAGCKKAAWASKLMRLLLWTDVTEC